ncbi:unnamed protein product, partial [Ixodes pacificus]
PVSFHVESCAAKYSFKMLMPKKNRVAIYEYLFKDCKSTRRRLAQTLLGLGHVVLPSRSPRRLPTAQEGVLVAKKDFHAPKHPELEAIPNLQVIKALQSLRSRGYVKEQFAWRHYYWYLTNEGIQYLRDFLHLPPEIVPATLKKQSRQEAPSRR